MKFTDRTIENVRASERENAEGALRDIKCGVQIEDSSYSSWYRFVYSCMDAKNGVLGP